MPIRVDMAAEKSQLRLAPTKTLTDRLMGGKRFLKNKHNSKKKNMIKPKEKPFSKIIKKKKINKNYKKIIINKYMNKE